MRTRPSHPVTCLVALTAYLLNLAAIAGGAVVCQDPAGASSIEVACDHDHCAATVDTEHDHDSGRCWCSSCPCEDTPLALDVAPLLKDDDVRASMRNVPAIIVKHFATVRLPASQVLRTDRLLSAFDRTLRQRRTVVLIE